MNTNTWEEGLPLGQLVTNSLRETSGNLQPPVTSKQLGARVLESQNCSPLLGHTRAWSFNPNSPSPLKVTMKENIDLGLLFCGFCCLFVVGFFNPFWKKTCWRWLGEGVCERGESSGDVSSYRHGNWAFLVTMESSSLSCWVAWGAGASRAGAHKGIQLTKTIASSFPRKRGGNYKWTPEYMAYVTKAPSGAIAANNHYALW